MEREYIWKKKVCNKKNMQQEYDAKLSVPSVCTETTVTLNATAWTIVPVIPTPEAACAPEAGKVLTVHSLVNMAGTV